MAVKVWSIWASCWSRKYPQSFHLGTVNVMMMMVMMTIRHDKEERRRTFTGVKIHKLNLRVVNVVESGTELVNL